MTVPATQNFGRQCKLEVFNESNQEGIVIYGSGLKSNYELSEKAQAKGYSDKFVVDARISFEVQKVKRSGALPVATIRIYNTARNNEGEEADALTNLLRNGMFCRLYAGYFYNFENLEEEMKPIFEGEIVTIRDIQIQPNNYKLIKCFGGLQARSKKCPPVSIRGKITPIILLQSLQHHFENNSLNLTLDLPSFKSIYPQYQTTIMSNRGFAFPQTYNIDTWLSNFTTSISTETSKIGWYFNDVAQRIFFFDYFGKKNTEGTTTLKLVRGENAKLVDDMSIDRNSQELYFKNKMNAQKITAEQRRFERIGRGTTYVRNSYIIQSRIIPNIDLDTIFKLVDFSNVPKDANIHTMRWIGDTHGMSDEWKIEYIFEYDKRDDKRSK